MRIISGPGPLGRSISMDELDFTPALILVESQKITGSAVTAVTFSSLDINADIEYIIVADLPAPDETDILLEINGEATAGNYRSSVWSSLRTRADADSQVIAKFIGGIVNANIQITIHRINSWAVARGFSWTWFPEVLETNIGVICKDNATVGNITSITLKTSAASRIKVDSVISLFKRTRS